MEGSPMYSV
jgi:ADP-heptose:LPS heptosyltransferase